VAFAAQAILQAATVIEQYEKHALDVLMRHPLPQVLEKSTERVTAREAK
jgi:hypothetical protein